MFLALHHKLNQTFIRMDDLISSNDYISNINDGLTPGVDGLNNTEIFQITINI